MSRQAPPPLLALHGDADARYRLRAVAGSGPASRIVGPAVFASGWQELGELVAAHPRSPAVVDPAFAGDADPTSADSIRVLRGSSVSLVCYGEPSALRAWRVQDGGYSVAAVLQPGAGDDLAAVESAVLRAAGARRVRRLLDEIGRRADRQTEETFACVLGLAVAPCSVPELAAELGLSQRTLWRRCAALGVPTPGRLLALGRIFTVERLAEWSGQPSGAVALAIGFSDYANYRRLVRRTLGAPPSEIRKQGGVGEVAMAILRALAARKQARVHAVQIGGK